MPLFLKPPGRLIDTPAAPTPTMTNSLYGLTDFAVQIGNGSTWTTVPNGQITGNKLVWREIAFPAQTASQVRIVATADMGNSGFARIVEVEAYNSTAQHEAFSYDKVGNRLTHSRNGTTRYYRYAPNGNRLAEIRRDSASGPIDSAYTFDAEGRLTEEV